MYQAQCRKPEGVKEQVRKAHRELVEREYMVPLDQLDPTTQELITSAPFKHYYPWRAVYKEESVTTPVRLVVDPTMTGLNEILAKGSNMLSKIPEILINFRCAKHTWCTDISKLYNQLHLNPSSLPFSLFLFSDELDPKSKPQVWVMTRAWYGVVSSGNQAGVALETLAMEHQLELPLALKVLIEDRYVDDVVSGANTPEERQEQIRQTRECLAKGGFTLKFAALS